MDSISATSFNNPFYDDYLIAETSPVFSQKPIFFAIDPIDQVTDEIEENVTIDSLDHETKDEFKGKVKQRKLQGFIGTEYTVEEAMSKQFGPEQIEARAFLEYYWEMKAKCLEAVEKKKKSEFEAFLKHPLFSPSWLVPSRRDIRWHLKNNTGNEEDAIFKEESLSGSKPQTLSIPAVNTKVNHIQLKAAASRKRIPTNGEIKHNLQSRSAKSKNTSEVRMRELRKPEVKWIPISSNSNASKRFPTNGPIKNNLQSKSAESKNGSELRLKELRKRSDLKYYESSNNSTKLHGRDMKWIKKNT